jgi:ankyrin repeat protein
MAQVSDIDFQDETGANAMHYACIQYQARKESLKNFIQDKEGRTCLHCAVRCGHEYVTKLILLSKPSIVGDLVNFGDYQNRKPIHEAAIGGNMLLNAGALFDVAEDTRSFLPIHFAAATGHVEMVEWLIERGGQSLHAESNCKREPLDLSDGFGWDIVTELLQHQIKGEPIHCVLTTARYPWLVQGDSALSPKAKRKRQRLKKARNGGRTEEEEQLYDHNNQQIKI